MNSSPSFDTFLKSLELNDQIWFLYQFENTKKEKMIYLDLKLQSQECPLGTLKKKKTNFSSYI